MQRFLQLVECPSIYEMLPNPDFGWTKQPKIEVWQKQVNDGETTVEMESYGPVESISLFEEALKENEVGIYRSYGWFAMADLFQEA